MLYVKANWVHNNVNVSFEGGWEKKKKGLHAFPFSPEVETFYWMKGDKSAFTLMTAYHEDVSARVKVFVARKLATDFNWKVVTILPTAFSKTLSTSLS